MLLPWWGSNWKGTQGGFLGTQKFRVLMEHSVGVGYMVVCTLKICQTVHRMCALRPNSFLNKQLLLFLSNTYLPGLACGKPELSLKI